LILYSFVICGGKTLTQSTHKKDTFRVRSIGVMTV